jgi:phage baseplate assembly protein W
MAHKQPTRLYSDLDLSFNVNPITGDIGKKVDVNSVRQAMEILLKTKYREKPFTPRFGSPIYSMMFEPMDFNTAKALEGLIEDAFLNWEPRVEVSEVACSPNFDDNEYDIFIYFYVKGIREQQVFRTTLTRLR